MRASDLMIKEVSTQEERNFLNKNHYQGYIQSKIAYGLYKNDELYEIMTFGRPRYNQNYKWELLRLCTKRNEKVYGGASKLFKYFVENNEIETGIISYCNRDKFNGDVYRILGFKSSRITKGYHYEKDGKIYHRSNFTKQNCLKLWPQYKDVTISERKIMEQQGFTRVEDKIGQELFIYNDNAKYYIYKLTFEDGSTYIGQHVQYKENDKYVTSSSYAKNHKIKSREILLYVNDKFTLDLIETAAIIGDKCNSSKNVNGNLGNFIFTHPFNTRNARNYKWSESTRKIMKEKMTGHPTTRKTREKISKANKGRKWSEESRLKASNFWKDYYKTHNHPNKDKRLSEELKQRISNSVKGFKHTEETKRKISEFNKGKVMSEEARRKISLTKTGKKRSESLKQRISETKKGTHWWTNGKENQLVVGCPGQGWYRGKIQKLINKK